MERERARRGGWKRPDRKSRLTDVHLRALYRAYIEQGVSIDALAKRVYARVGYRSHHSAAVAISEGWKRLGLPARDRLEAVRLACTVHGMAPKHGPRPGYGTYRRRLESPDQPRCEAVKSQPPGRGERCARPAMFGSRFCVSHDPARELQRQASLGAMRRKLPAVAMVPMEPFSRWLRDLAAELGSMREVARRLDGPYTALCCYARGLGSDKQPKAMIACATVARYADAAGSSLDAIYGREELAA